MSAPKIVDVRIEAEGTGFCVTPVWYAEGVTIDRPASRSWLLPKRELAERFARALRAGVALVEPEILVDVAGETYVSSRCTVLARHMNAELRKLGY